MISREIIKKIRRIEIVTSRLVTDVFAGQYHSVFKGRGMEFDEVREYQWGDDIRAIDWNVTARTGRAHIKKYVEERELTVMLLVDASMSCRFASTSQLKSRLAAEIAAVLAFAAIRNSDKAGLVFFTDRIEKFIPPRKGTRHVLRVIREILCFEPAGTGTDITAALEYLNRVTRRRTVAFVISDFFETAPRAGAVPGGPVYEKALATAGKRHDLIAVTLNDPREYELPSCGLVMMEDAENYQRLVLDTAHPAVRTAYRRRALERLDRRSRFFKRLGVDHIDISTDKPYPADLMKFFLQRRRRKIGR